MLEINQVTNFKLSVYHSFTDEVDQARQHVWLCDGRICPKRAPYYGVVMRARNMPPGPQDWWFAKHGTFCGGRYLKVLEPAPKPLAPKKQAPKKQS